MKQKPEPWFSYPNYQWRQKHAVIIGAGVAGCQLSWHLSRAGWQVTLLEQAEQICKGASGNPAGVVSPKMTALPSPGETFYRQAFSYAIGQLNALKARNPSVPWQPCGMLQMAHNEREAKRWDALQQREDLFLQDGERLLECVDAIKASVIAGINCPMEATYFPKAGWLAPREFCELLLTDSGCDLHLNTKVGDIRSLENVKQVFNDSGDLITTADVVVFASGHEANTAPQTSHIPMAGVLGQSSLLEPQPDTEGLRCVIGHQGYITPAFQMTGRASKHTPVKMHAFGASYKRHFNNQDLSSSVDLENIEQLQSHLPRFSVDPEAVSSGHAAIRATTPDRFPIVGGLPNVAFYQQHYAWLKHGKQHLKHGIKQADYLTGLFILSGLGSRGLTTSGFCADLLSRLITGEIKHEDEQWLTRLHPARFLIKSLSKQTK